MIKLIHNVFIWTIWIGGIWFMLKTDIFVILFAIIGWSAFWLFIVNNFAKENEYLENWRLSDLFKKQNANKKNQSQK